MNKLTGFTFIAILSVLSYSSFAQSFGIKGGLNLNNIAKDYKVSDEEEATKMNIGYTFGLAVYYPLNDVISLQSGLEWSAKGFKHDLEDDLPAGATVDGYDKWTINYIDIPLHVAYNISGFQVYAGGFLGFGVSGKNKWDYTETENGLDIIHKGEESIKFIKEYGEGDITENESPLRRLNYGLNFGLGYRINAIQVNAGYSLGLANITPGIKNNPEFEPKDYKVSTRTINISAIYFFGQ